jgi:tannase/feruloyl esterase
MNGFNRTSVLGGCTTLVLICAVFYGASITARTATSCERLKSTKLTNVTITAANLVEAGAFTEASARGFDYKTLPAFCRVQAVSTPSTDSHIEFEVWLPASGWNGKYQGVGNGGFAGEITYSQMASVLIAGYATASTDTGHKGSGIDASWAFGHPEKVTDYGYRAIHETAEAAKGLIPAFYGEPAKYSYFTGCSNGGRQALMEAQRFPADYDGIIAGAPAAHFTRTAALFVSNLLATVDHAAFVPDSKYVAIEAAVVAACDSADGVKDGIVTEPTTCRFDPAVMLCRGAESDSCLTSPQIATIKKLYSGLQNAKGQTIHPGFVPGGESGPGGWGLWLSGPKPDSSLEYAFGTQFFKNMVHQNQAWDYRRFDVERDLEAADDAVGIKLNAVNPDLGAFHKRGGKLIVFHGWSDAALSPAATIEYHRAVVAKLGQNQTDAFVRTYMMPGLQHCSGGPGADHFGVLPGFPPSQPDPTRSLTAAMVRWVEQGVAPSAIVATKYKSAPPAEDVAFTRLICPYPAVARYKGTGSTDDAANYACAAR